MLAAFCLSWILALAAAPPMMPPRSFLTAESPASRSAEILPQEQLLAELLAELPAERRTAMIARALAASRQTAASAGDAERGGPKIEAAAGKTLDDLTNQLAFLQAQQELQAMEMAKLRREALTLSSRLAELQARAPRDLIGRREETSQTFVLPRFQRIVPPESHGPYVNQPSGPALTLRPDPDPQTEQAIAMELAQLSRDMFRLNQRLQQLQSVPAGANSPLTLAPQADAGSSEQARQPSPLLPR